MAKGNNLKVKLPKVQAKVPKPRIPTIAKPLGGGDALPDPPVSVANSQRAAKQQAGVNLPGIKT